MQVKNYMSPSPVTIPESSDYKTAFALMDKHRIHHLPVVNGSDQIVGILALRDLKLAANCFKEAPVEIADVMLTPVLTIQVNDSLSSAAQIMVEHRIGCLPVIDEENKLAGMLTETDLFNALRDLLDKAA